MLPKADAASELGRQGVDIELVDAQLRDIAAQMLASAAQQVSWSSGSTV